MDVALKRSLTQFYYNMNLQTLPSLFLWYRMRHPVQLWTFKETNLKLISHCEKYLFLSIFQADSKDWISLEWN